MENAPPKFSGDSSQPRWQPLGEMMLLSLADVVDTTENLL